MKVNFHAACEFRFPRYNARTGGEEGTYRFFSLFFFRNSNSPRLLESWREREGKLNSANWNFAKSTLISINKGRSISPILIIGRQAFTLWSERTRPRRFVAAITSKINASYLPFFPPAAPAARFHVLPISISRRRKRIEIRFVQSRVVSRTVGALEIMHRRKSINP